MKPTFKMTALSILVAFGVAACGSSSKGSPASGNSPINVTVPAAKNVADAQKIADSAKKSAEEAKAAVTSAQSAAQQAQAAAQEAKQKLAAAQKALDSATGDAKKAAQANLDAAKKAAEQAQAAEKQANSAVEQAQKMLVAREKAVEKANSQVERLQAEEAKRKQAEADKQKAEEDKKKAEEDKQKAEADKQKEEAKSQNNDSTPSSYVLNKNGEKWRTFYLGSYGYRNYLGTGFVDITSNQIDINKGLLNEYSDYLVDLDKLSGSKLGMHKGVINTADDLAPKSDGSSIKSIQYLFENQPYSSYGVLWADNGDLETFALGLSSGGRSGSRNYPYINISNDSYIPSVLGTATYKGKVISTTVTNKDGKLTRIEPKVDGTVTLTANFTKNPNLSTIQGEATSGILGKTIKLYNSSFDQFAYAQGDARVVGDNSFDGVYLVQIHGPNAEEAVGKIGVNNDNINYQAVFGAEKQPK